MDESTQPSHVHPSDTPLQGEAETPLLRLQAHILDGIEQAVIATDPGGRILYWNRYAEHLYGWSAAEVIGRDVVEITPAQMSQPQAAELMSRLQRGEKWSGEFLVQRRDGSTFWAHVTNSPVVNESGQLIAIVGFSVDITERKRVEGEVREHALTIETINRLGQILSAELDLHKLVQLVTDSATELVGAQVGAFFYNVTDDRGESYQLYTLSGASPDAFAGFPMPRNTDVFGPTFRGEGVIRSANIRDDQRYGHNAPYHGLPQGHLPVTSYLAVPVISRSGEVLGGLFFGHEEAAMFTAQSEQIAVGLAGQTAIAMDNARLYEEAQQAIRARDHFLSMAAHELKTPMTVMLGYVQLLERQMRREAFTDRTQQAVQTLAAQTGRLNQLVHTLFDLSRIQMGKLALNRTLVDLSALAQRVVADLQPTLQQHTLQYESDSPNQAVVIEADVQRLEQVLLNLLQNAVKYSPTGGTIRVLLERQHDHVALSVHDSGIGIPDDAVPHVFNRFYRATNVQSATYSGMGMGLYLVKEIVTLHGGSVEVTSRLGQGSCFRIVLPML